MLTSFAQGRVFGATWGSGPATVVALHGWARTHRDFDGVFDPPAHRAPGEQEPGGGGPTAVALDLFGFGATPAPETAWGTAEYAQALLPLLGGGEVADRVTVVGHSFGGRVAVRLAALAPDRVDRLVLTGVPLLHRSGRRATPALAFRVGRRLHRLGLVGEDRMEALRQKYGSPDYRAATGVMREVLVRSLAESYDDDLAALACPVELVWGARDTEVPVEVAERARALVPAATLRVLDGVGHLTPTEAPAALRAAILTPGRPAADPA